VSLIGSRKLVILTGKGGVGRSTLAAALGLAVARSGRRACVVELAGLCAIPPLLGLQGRSYLPRTVAGRLDVRSLTPLECMQDFGNRKLGMGGVVRLVLRTRITSAFLEAVPGLQDLVQLGKIENMISEPRAGEPRYDVVILDGPATGHGLTLLSAARAMREMTRVGPFHDLAAIIERFLADSSVTAVVPVTLLEELPVHETLELAEGLDEERATLASVIANQVVDAPLPSAGWPQVRAELARHEEAVRWLGMAQRVIESAAAQAEVLDHLRSSLAAIAGPRVPIVPLPRLDPRDPVGLVRALAERLGGAL
jgi:anion-transporting  ArsA/GET3 family ATPase